MRNSNIKPPQLARLLMKFLTTYQDDHSIAGDIEEVYYDICTEKGKFYSNIWFWYHTMCSIIQYLLIACTRSSILFKNYLKIAIRNLRRNVTFSFLNLLGLAVGLTSFILILLYVQYEFSFDKYHENSNKIYRIIHDFAPGHTHGGKTQSTYTIAPLGEAMVNEFPEVLSSIRIFDEDEVVVKYGEKSFVETNVIFTDPELFDIFSFTLLKGDNNTAMDDPYSVILSQRMVNKYFGDEDPIGRVININYTKVKDFKVTGVINNIPKNSHFDIDFIIPYKTFGIITGRELSDWDRNQSITYVQIADQADPGAVESKLPALIRRHSNVNPDAVERHYTNHYLQPLTDIHLHSNIDAEFGPNNNITNIYFSLLTAIMILVIACINYMNLSTARSMQRGKEVGIRKVVGALRKQLLGQFFSESGLLTFFAFIAAIVITVLILPVFNNLIERDLTIDLLLNMRFLIWISVALLFVVLFAGSYPAFIISSYKPNSILRGYFKGKSKGSVVRNTLVVVQFSISIIFIVSTIIVKDQLAYIKNKDVGFNKEQIVVVRIRGSELRNSLETIITELKRNPDIIDVSSSTYLPNNIRDQTVFNWPGKPENIHVETHVGFIDYNFIDVYDIEIIEGRNFSINYPSDGSEGAFLINESAVKALGWDKPIGKDLKHWNSKVGKVVGVMKDFNYTSLHRGIEPLYLYLEPKSRNYYLSAKINGNNISETLDVIKNKLNEYSTRNPFDYSFFDEIFNNVYMSEQRIERMLSVFAFVAIILACFGLFGLVSFTAENKTKEIGIRKVLGASVFSVISLMTKDFLKWVLIGSVIAFPVALYIMNQWLQKFAFKISIGLLPFILAIIIAVALSVLTISFQSIKAALKKPVDSLRYE